MKKIVTIVIFFIVCLSLPVFASTDAKVNINTATQEELVSLKMIGPAYSKKIIEYRETMGPFEKPEDIMHVKGISDKIFEMNKDRIVVKDTESSEENKS